MLTNLAFAHSRGYSGDCEEVTTHLRRVAKKAESFASAFGAEAEARFVAILHDCGKFGERFQARLRGELSGVDHWSIGARLACMERNWEAWAAALAIEGHHIGIQCGVPSEIKLRLRPNESWSVTDAAALRDRLAAEGLPLTSRFNPLVDLATMNSGKNVSIMLGVRMLFSGLVDADFLATEEHFDGAPRPVAPLLDAMTVEELVESELAKLESGSEIHATIAQLRRDVGTACRWAAELPPGLFTLSAPTGSGKTLALLLFAARHARLFGMRRIVVALPYLTITDQTVKTYARVLQPWLASLRDGTGLLEHHSLAGTAEAKGELVDLERKREILAENWDAPVVVTTTVQLLESLFANRPGACRKLHRLAGSVILLDEVQTIPTELAVPTLAALSYLAERFGVTAVLATATQPAFRRLDKAVRKQVAAGWQPREICPPERKLFSRFRRYRAEWIARDGETSDEALLQMVLEAASVGSVLLIANLKRQALRWHRHLASQGLGRLNHLSTNMTPAHRRRVLGFWEDRENTRAPRQVLVTTQCVEAGVDLDFPAVFRAFGPLDSMAQAAGRVNRNGRFPEGKLVVFKPTESRRAYPDGAYAQAADEAMILLKQAGWPEDLERPELFDQYFGRLYQTRGTSERTALGASEFDEALLRLDFPKIADLYRLIPGLDAVNVLCPDGPEFGAFCEEVRNGRLTAKWVRRARLHAVNIFRPAADSPAWAVLTEVMLNGREGKVSSGDWFVLRDAKLYDEGFGLQLDQLDPNATIA